MNLNARYCSTTPHSKLPFEVKKCILYKNNETEVVHILHQPIQALQLYLDAIISETVHDNSTDNKHGHNCIV